LLGNNPAIKSIAEALTARWADVHKGEYFANPSVSFARNEMDSLLRHLSVGFTPGHGDAVVDFSRLSDGQQSLLYLSLVLATQEIGRRVLRDELGSAFDVDKLRPAVFVLIAVEEPENSLSPHYLGRVIRALTAFSEGDDAQAIIATHSPSLLRRTPPETIRYFRLDTERNTTVASIELPTDGSAYKFVREAVQAFPELYFSRFVVLGEGDSEEIVLPRLLEARGILGDDASISVVPLGGRHVNHFWRLLSGLGIPHVTLLDLDLARYHGGWGRVRYAAKELLKYSDVSDVDLTEEEINSIPTWNGEQGLLLEDDGWISRLEKFGIFFSTPLDLDFMMMRAYPAAYRVEDDDLTEPDEATIRAVLGKSHDLESQYSDSEQSYFDVYQSKFKLDSKPAWHLRAAAHLDDEDLQMNMPEVLERMFEHVENRLKEVRE
jgi:putative ATP-dependent endonuclease of OLD family